MYGMVNRAIEEMVCAHYGENRWAQITARAAIEVDVFVSNEAYPDEMTYALVAAASQVLDVPAGQMLEEFGRYWVLHTARIGYGDLLAAGGDSLPQFLYNLPGFHARVALIYPNLQPPTFRVSDITPTSLHLHYFTHRQGMQSFLIGLVLGLAELFDTAATVRPLLLRSAGHDHDVFLIEWPLPTPVAGAAAQMVTP